MPRKRSPAVPSRAKSAAESNNAGLEKGPAPTVPLLFFALVTLTFGLLYYGITAAQLLQKHWPTLASLFTPPEQFLQQRWQTLAFLLAPDELFLIWCGGKLAY